MIVVDEQLHNERIYRAIDAYYPGQVISICDLRPGTVIKDDNIPTLLIHSRQPTFITINADDFWLKINAHSAYCIVNFPLPADRRFEVPEILRRVLQHPHFNTKAKRMGHVLRVSRRTIRYYRIDRQLNYLDW
ncbi:MAG: hypothetical protein GY796_16175 [Chloroflexi bacterium]|nr:hypothetical protein [Chloroflexota bacterium]